MSASKETHETKEVNESALNEVSGGSWFSDLWSKVKTAGDTAGESLRANIYGKENPALPDIKTDEEGI